LRKTKLGKERLVPIHPSTCAALRRYQDRRDQIYPRASTQGFFLAERGGRLREGSVRKSFRKISCQIGLRDPSASRGPRMHDLRHRFAVQTLIGWYRSDVDVEAKLPKLATYLGHSQVRDTYWYLTATSCSAS
jgi:integrase/recombinase XerD